VSLKSRKERKGHTVRRISTGELMGWGKISGGDDALARNEKKEVSSLT